MPLAIQIDRDQIVELCRKHSVSRLSFFGSVTRDDFTPQSDVDILVEFEPGCTPGLAFFGLEVELSEIFGRDAHLCTLNMLTPRFRDSALADVVLIYDKSVPSSV